MWATRQAVWDSELVLALLVDYAMRIDLEGTMVVEG